MILWKKEFDPFVNVQSVDTTAFLPIIFSPPGIPQTVQISVYLPTAGKESLFLDDLAKLKVFVDKIRDEEPET